MAKSVVEGKTSDFWSEVKRIKRCKSTVIASEMAKLMTAALRIFLPISIKHCITLCHMIRLNSEKFMIQLMLLS